MYKFNAFLKDIEYLFAQNSNIDMGLSNVLRLSIRAKISFAEPVMAALTKNMMESIYSE